MHFLIPRFLNLKYFTEERYKYLMFSSRIPAPICNKKKVVPNPLKSFDLELVQRQNQLVKPDFKFNPGIITSIKVFVYICKTSIVSVNYNMKTQIAFMTLSRYLGILYQIIANDMNKIKACLKAVTFIELVAIHTNNEQGHTKEHQKENIL